jgi:hypothetical protein
MHSYIKYYTKHYDLVKSQYLDGKVKSSKFKACEFRGMRRTFRTTQ